MADYTPFNALLDPSKQGTLTGFLGGVMGMPTQAQAEGGSVGLAMKAISELRSQGKTPQQAALEFFGTPQGQDFFANAGKDGMDQLIKGIAATQPPAPVLHNIPEGGMLTATDPVSGKTTIGAQNPKSYAPTALKPGEQMFGRSGEKLAENTNVDPSLIPAEVRNFQYFSSVAKLPSEEIQKLARMKIDPTMAPKNSVESQAIDEMVEKYGLDPGLAEKIKGGVLKVMPQKNQLGQDTGAITLFDLSTNTATSFDPRQKNSEAPGSTVGAPAPGTTQDTGAGAGVLPPSSKDKTIPQQNPKFFGDKASMFLGSGVVPSALAGASSITEQLNPSMVLPEGAQAADRQNLINTLRSDLSAMGTMGEGLSVNKGVIEGYLKLAPTGKAGESPHQAVQKAIRLHEHVTQEIAAEEAKLGNPNIPLEEQKGAIKRAEGWKRVLRDLPTYEQLGEMEKSIREGTAGAATVAGGVKTVAGAAAKALTEGKKQAGEAAKDVGLGDQPNIDAINDPKELLAIDPRTLSKENKIKLLRKLDKLGGGKRSEADQPYQVAGDVVSFPESRSTLIPNTTAVKNQIGIRRGGGGPNVIPIKRG